MISEVLTQALDNRFDLFPKQADIIYDVNPVKIIRAARRTAKSWTTAFEAFCIIWFCGVWKYPFHIRFGGPTYDDAIHTWQHFKKFWAIAPLDEVFDNLKVGYDNWNSKSTNKKVMEFQEVDGEQSWIKTGTGDDPNMDDFRGDWHDFIGVDEFGQFKYKEFALDAIFYSIKDAGPINEAMIVGTSDVTIDLGDTFERLVEIGEASENNGISSFTLREMDNPYRDSEAADVSKSIVTEDGYRREALGENVPPTGRLFDEFQAKIQVTETLYIPALEYIIGIDWGFRKPVVEFLQLIIIDSEIKDVRFFYEIAGIDIATPDLILKLEAAIKYRCNNRAPMLIGCDPAGDQVNAQTALSDFLLLKKAYPQAMYTTNVELRSKANQVNLLWRPLIPKVKIDPKCKKLATAISRATPDRTINSPALNSGGWKKVKGLDDPLDAATYGLLNFAPTANMILDEKTRPKQATPDVINRIRRNMGY